MRVEPVVLGAIAAEEGVRLDPGLLLDLVLEQPVHHDHVGPDELSVPRDLVDRELPVVYDELEVERRDPAARVARTRRGAIDRRATLREREVARLHRGDERGGFGVGTVDGVSEDGVALELGEREPAAHLLDDRVDQVGEDVGGMLQLDPGQVLGVTADVREDQAAPLNPVHASKCY